MTKLLLVEDDNNLREIYEARLAAEGYEISAAQDGEEALEVAKKVQPDLIISDVMMPRISGFEMLDILRNTQGLKHTKVIMLTALGQEEDKTRADSLGADRYLVKSQVTLEDIVKAADELINGASQPESEEAPEAAPAPSEQLSPTAPPAVAAAAHTPVNEAVEQPAATLNTFENNQVQPAASAAPATATTPEPVVGGPVPVTAASVADDPMAANDQALQAAANELTATAVPTAELATPAPAPAEPQVPVAAQELTPAPMPEATAPVVPAITPAVIDPAPAAPTTPTTPEPSVTPPADPSQPAHQTVIAPPEAQTQQLPSLPEIERAMQESAQAAAAAPAQGMVNGAPGVVTPTEPAAPAPTPTPEAAQQAPTPAPEPTPAPVTEELARPTLISTPTPEIAIPDAQSTAQEASVVSNQIADFGAQFPGNVGEVVEAPGTAVPPVATPEQPAAQQMPATPSEVPTSVTPVAVTEAPTDPVAAPTQTPATGGQRTIQPLAPTTPAVDINTLAAQEGMVTPPTSTPDLPHQPGGVFTPNQGGNANDAAL